MNAGVYICRYPQAVQLELDCDLCAYSFLAAFSQFRVRQCMQHRMINVILWELEQNSWNFNSSTIKWNHLMES